MTQIISLSDCSSTRSWLSLASSRWCPRLGRDVTMIMLPVGPVIGLLGFGLLAGGLFVHIDAEQASSR